MDFDNFYKTYINDSKKKGWNYMYSKKMVKQKVDKINTLNQQINQESTFDGKLLLDNQIKNIFGEFTTEPLLKKGIEKTNKGKRVERVKIIQKQQRGDFTPLHPSPLRKSILNGGRKKRVYGGPSPKRTKSLFKKKRTKKKKRKSSKRTKSLFKKKRTKKKRRYGGPSPKTYKKCAKFFTKKHKLTQKKALKMCKVMFG